jgi:predicted DCC family thiol-disulfide oxidoreductase YuxK
MLLFTRGDTFNMFFYAMSASMLIFANWPTGPIQVIFDGDCGFCTRVKEWYERIDLEEMFRWAPYQSGIGRTYGIPESETSMRLYLINGAKVYSGFRACRMLLLCNPVSYLLTYVALAAPGPGPSAFRDALVVTLLVLFSPLFDPIGEALYKLIAGNRHRIPIAGSCQIK